VIDFRYHLISIVAVLLALAIGIFAGSGFLGGPLLDDLRGRLTDLKQTNKEVHARNGDLRAENKEASEFTAAVEPLLVTDALLGDRVVIFQFEGTDGGTVDGLQDELELAGAVIPSRITFSSKFALDQTTDRDQLALIIRSTEARAAELRREAAEQIASAAATAGAFAGGEPRGASAAVQRFHTLLDQLERAGFVGLEQLDGEEPVPPGSDFVIVGGSADPAPFDVAAFVAAMGRVIGSKENSVIVAEPEASVWGITTAIRDGHEEVAATSDGADSLSGRIATVLGLAAAKRGEIGHYGRGPGATGLVPTPSPGA
jgi:hypothetical protein